MKFRIERVKIIRLYLYTLHAWERRGVEGRRGGEYAGEGWESVEIMRFYS
jgi:hypothetical protein